MTDAEAPRPRPRPVPEDGARPRPVPAHPRSTSEPDEPTADSPGADEPTADSPGADEPTQEPPAADQPTADAAGAAEPVVPRPTRASRKAEQRRGSRVPARIGRSVAVLCVLAGVAGFVVVRAQDGPGSAGASGAPSSSASSAASNPDAEVDDSDLASTFTSTASTGVVTVTESDYRRLDDALSAGLSVTTGSFRTRFRAALTGAAAASRVANRSTTSLSVLQSGIGTIYDSGTRAKVLIFARVTQTGNDIGAGDRSVLTTLCVTMQRDGNSYLISDLVQGGNANLPPGTAGLRAAAEAARREVINTLSYSRTGFAAALARAEAGATGAALSTITQGAPALRSRLTAGGFDLTGAVTAIAVQNASGSTATLLVAATGTRVGDDGSSDVDSDDRYLATVQRVGGTWLLSSLTSVS